ncbi:MAG: TonB family protein [Flammeovirgaceae bacterium]|jgi:protein TonB|nr:TonB family protein [Flammeovirgaceae bacterium]
MEAKKSLRADINRWHGTLFSFSLLITMLLMVLAFEWKTSDRDEKIEVVRTTNVFEPLAEVPPTEIKSPPAPVVQQPTFVVVPDEEEIKQEIKFDLDVEVTTETKVQEYIPVELPKVIEEETDKIFLVVEQTAVPKNGMAGFYKYVSENLRYPAPARRMGVEGKIYVQFVVDKDGSITDVTTVNSLGAGLEEEAIRILKAAPPWTPGRQRGKPVKQRMVIPIFFKLAQ